MSDPLAHGIDIACADRTCNTRHTHLWTDGRIDDALTQAGWRYDPILKIWYCHLHTRALRSCAAETTTGPTLSRRPGH